MHYLDKLLNPTSIAVIGASNKTNSVGKKVFKNLLQGKYVGKLYPVNPKHKKIQQQTCYASVNEIKDHIDLAVITTPAKTVPKIMAECAEKNIGAAVIISAGFSETGSEGKELEQSFLNIARQHHIRLIGPNCLGIMRPHIKLNATFDNNFASPGHLALVSQSGALCAAILDWAVDKEIGFSAMVSLGNSADIGFGEVLDYLALDTKTKSILLYIEGIHNPRSFLSGLRAAARMKPVIAIKGGRHAQGSRAALSHTGALIGDDDVFDAALRRAGVVRVMTIEQLFSAAEIFSTSYHTPGNRLAIITNGGGAGVMAADRATELNVVLPKLSDDSFAALNKVLPATWSHQNPVDIIGDATPDRYHATIDVCMKDENIDGLLTILVPIAMTQPRKVAEQIIADAKQSKKPLLACWMGEHQVKSSWDLFSKNKLPCFNTPEEAVEAFSYLADYTHNQQLLLQVPEPLAEQCIPDMDGARLIIESVLAEQRKLLTVIESKAVLKAFGIPCTQTIEVHSANEALMAAESLGFPVVMKINSPDISHKQDVGGVQLNITNASMARNTFNKLMENVKHARPDAKILGVTVECMYHSSNDRELIIGVVRDKVFGPVISFGAGGTFVEIMRDRAVALPPLNKFIAQQLIAKTRIAKMLNEFRNMPAVNLDNIINILLRVSEMVCEFPQIQELDINPLIANDQQVIAVDARIVVDFQPTSLVPYQHMAIHPYPSHLVSSWQLADGTDIAIRPIRPEDARYEMDFIKSLSAETKYFRFMHTLQELTKEMLIRFTQIDYDREMSLVATHKENAKEKIIAIARYITNPDFESCEFAIVVADAWQNKGIGFRLMTNLIEIAKNKGLRMMSGEVLASNTGMLTLVQHLGFSIASSEDASIKTVTKLLREL